ncbi:MAG: hypothetical protein GY862_17615 [Gammaproteobacteria bacterium]|nr:hypothetical protein [Gammaproteobacteria bacterium]
MFEYDSTGWKQKSKLTGDDTQAGYSGYKFGHSVAVDGNTIIVGSHWFSRDQDHPLCGSAYVFELDPGTGDWVQKIKLSLQNAQANDQFGTSVAISGDTVVIGVPFRDNDNISDSGNFGAAYVFVRDAYGNWTEQAELKLDPVSDNVNENDEFGKSVAISGDTVLIGSPFEDPHDTWGYDWGSVYVFVRNGTEWTKQAKLIAAQPERAYFGYSVAISGNTAVIGAYMDDDHLGSAYVKERGFADENIQYFNYKPQSGVDGIPGKQAIKNALTDLQGRMNGSPAPFYAILVDHGGFQGSFYIDNGNNERIAPEEFAGWFDDFEAGLTPQALEKPRITIVGACYSGAFIPALSGQGRIIITSAAADEESYKGPMEPDTIRSGELFMEEFFQHLARGKSFKTAFEKATEIVEISTRHGGNPANFFNGFQDLALQHPLLDDNGDGLGSNVLTHGGDGVRSENLYLGAGLDHRTNPAGPPEIVSITDTLFLEPDESSDILFINVNNIDRVEAAPVYIRQPSTVLSRDEQPHTEQPAEQLEIKELVQVAGDLTCDSTVDRCEKSVDIFDEAGMYEAFYFVSDSKTGDMSPIKRSVVYKKRHDNSALVPFDLLLPGDGETTKTVLIFDWEETVDPDGFTYTFSIAADREFDSVVYTQEELLTSMTYIDDTAVIKDGRDNGMPGLRDQTTYCWKVTAVDSFGGKTESSVFSFYTNNSDGMAIVLHVNPLSSLNYGSVPEADINLTHPAGASNFPTAYSSHGGNIYLLPLETDLVSGTIQADGFQDTSFAINVGQETITTNVLMPPVCGSSALRFSVANPAMVDENGKNISIYVERMQSSCDPVQISYNTKDGTANADEDYQTVTGLLSWPHGDMRNRSIFIPIYDDESFEENETFKLTLSAPQGATLTGPAQMEITIKDNDIPPVSILEFSQLVYDSDEGQLAAAYVTRENSAIGKVSVHCVTGDSADSALPGNDYTSVEHTLSWADGEDDEKTCEVPTLNDKAKEKSEFVTLKLTDLTGHAQLGARGQAVLSIADIPPAYYLTVIAGEGGQVTYEYDAVEPGVPCTSDESDSQDCRRYLENTQVTLAAKPDAGWIFDRWGDDDCKEFGTTSPISLLSDKDRTCTAHFIDPDYDGDGIPDVQEEKAPNNGDGNGDGIADLQQADVASFPDAVNGNYLTAVIDNPECKFTAVRKTTMYDEENSDPGYDYPQGLSEFVLACPAGAAAGVSVYHHAESLTPSEYTYRYFNASSNSWDDSAGIVDSYPINGQEVLQAQYTLTDGQAGDDSTVPGEILSLGGLAWHAGLPRFSSREYEVFQDAGEVEIPVRRDGIGELTIDFNVRRPETGELYQGTKQLHWAAYDDSPKTISVQIHSENEILMLSLDNLANVAGVVRGRIDTAWLIIRPIPVAYINVKTEESFILETDSGTNEIVKEPDPAIVDWEFDGEGDLILTGVSHGHTHLKLHNDTASSRLIVDITVFPKKSCPAPSDGSQAVLIDVSCDAFGLVYDDAVIAEDVEVFNMKATGTVQNAGTVFNLTLRETGDFSGGTLSGSVVNLGTVADLVFDQVLLVGGTLAGTISGTGRVQGVLLAAEAHLSGVTVADSIRGDAGDPALLENVVVSAGAYLANILLGENIQFEDKVPAGENIFFTSMDVIPMEPDLLNLFPELPEKPGCMDAITGNPRRDLSVSIVQDGPALLDLINAIPLLQENSWEFEQEPHFGHLGVDVKGIRFEQQVMSIKRVAAEAGVEVLNQPGVRFITESGLEAVSRPALQAPCMLQGIIEELGFPEMVIPANGNLRVPVDAGTWISARPDWISDVLDPDAEPGVSEAESPYSTAVSGKLAFMDAKGQLRGQLVYPAPAHPDEFPVNELLEFGPHGWFSFELEGRRYQGAVDYWVASGKNAAKILQVNSVGDVNGDGLADFRLLYPGGDSQTLFGVKK